MRRALLIAAIVLGACAAPGADDAAIGDTDATTATTLEVAETASAADEIDPADSGDGGSPTTVTTGVDLDGDDGNEERRESSTTTTRPDQTPTGQPGQTPKGETVPEQTDPTSTGEVPSDVMASVFSAAEAHTGMDRSAMMVLRAESVIWPDGSLGCPEPGITYTMATVDGYWIELSAGDTTLDYRVGSKGTLKLCESGLGITPPDRDS